MKILLCFFSVLNIVAAVSLGALVLLRNRRTRVNAGFALGMATLSIIEAGGLLLISDSPYLEAAGARLFIAGQALLPAGWLLFSTSFARNGGWASRWRPVLWAFTFAGGYFIYLAGPGFVLPPGPEISEAFLLSGEAPLYRLGKSGEILHVFMILGLMVNLVHLENTLRSSRGDQRQRIKYPVLAIGALLAFFIYNSAEALLFRSVEVRMVPLTTAVVFLSLAVMSAFIVKHRLMDINVYVSRYVVYNSVTVLITGTYLVVTGAIAHGISRYSMPLSFFLTGLFVFVASLGLVVILFNEILKKKTENFISRHFYRHKYDFKRRWMEAIEKLGAKDETDEIISTLSGILSRALGTSMIGIWIYDRVARLYRLESGKCPEGFEKIRADHAIVKALESDKRPFMHGGSRQGSDAVYSALKPEARKALDACGASICAPIHAKGETLGFILIGPDICREPYCQDDLDLVRALASQTVLQIKSIHLAQEVAEAKESELFHNMSSFIIHDLKNLTNSLTLLSRNADVNMGKPEFQKDAIKSIRNTVSKMKALIERLSDKDNAPDLKKSPGDPVAAVERAIAQLSCAGLGKPAIINESGPGRALLMDSGAMESVFINLLSNAWEAAGRDGEVKVRSYLVPGWACIAVSDNGPGISKKFIETSLFRPFRSTKDRGFGIGLYHCKSVVEAHGGTIEAESGNGMGTTFTVKLPLKADCVAV